jgi:hypothetical protein
MNENMNNDNNEMETSSDNGSDTISWCDKWSDEEKAKLQSLHNYHNDIYYFIDDLIRFGCSTKSRPKQPKTNLNEFMNITPKASSKLTGEQLHEYLTNKLVDLNNSDSVNLPDVSIIGENTTIEEMKQHLINGFQYLKIKQIIQFRVYLDYGKWLEAAYTKFNIEKKAGLITTSWQKWLLENVGITVSYGRKLRKLSNLFKNYSKFYNLSINFAAVYNKRKDISEMLRSNVGYESYWRNN